MCFFSLDEEEKEDEYKTSDIKTKTKQPAALGGAAANPFRYDSSSSDEEPEGGSTVQSLGVAAGSAWTQTHKFFLQLNDPRLDGESNRADYVLKSSHRYPRHTG